MDKLIRKMQTRDTKGNIKRLITELDKIDRKTMKKSSVSMYQIKKYTDDQVENMD